MISRVEKSQSHDTAGWNAVVQARGQALLALSATTAGGWVGKRWRELARGGANWHYTP
jgi:hypothetical protein